MIPRKALRPLLWTQAKRSVRKPADAPFTRLEWFVGQWHGYALAWLIYKALDRSDAHEANHLLASLAAGNTEPDGTRFGHTGDCALLGVPFALGPNEALRALATKET